MMGRSRAWLGASSGHEAGARCPTGFIFSSSGNRRRSRRNRQVQCWDSGTCPAIDSSCGQTAVRNGPISGKRIQACNAAAKTAV